MESARIRINDHRLMREAPSSDMGARVSAQRIVLADRSRKRRVVLLERTLLHSVVFVVSFIFASGVVSLSVLMFVRNSENLFGLVTAGLVAAASFVVMFAWIRTLVLGQKKERFTTPEEDHPEHHAVKSVVYGFVALVAAVLLAGLIMNTAAANSIAVG